MKKTNLIIASVFAINSLALSSPVWASSRVDQVAIEAVSQSKASLAEVKDKLLVVDASLADLESQIANRRGKLAKTFNGVSIGTAGIGLALTALAAVTITQKAAGSGMGALIIGIGGTIATIASALQPFGDQALTKEIDTQELETKLSAAKDSAAEMSLAAQKEGDSVKAALIANLNNQLQASSDLVKSLRDGQSKDTRDRLVSQLVQASGIALTVFALTQKESRASLIGPMLMTIGNIASLTNSLSDFEVDKVLAEVQTTRASVQGMASTL